MDRREVISKCMEMGVPIFQGKIDKTLFLASLKEIQGQSRSGGAGLAPPQQTPGGAPGSSAGDACLARARAARQLGAGYNRHQFAGSRGLSATRGEEEDDGGSDGHDPERCGDRVEDARGPAAPGRREARRQGRPAVQGPVEGRMGRRLLPRARRDRQGGLARPQELGIEPRRQGRHPLQHAARVDLLRLRDPRRGRHGRADLPDQLARGVPVRARPLRVQGGDPRGRRTSSTRSARSATSCRSSST